MTILNTMKLGYDMYRLYLRFHNLTPQKEEEMIEWMKAKMCWVTNVEGKWNMNAMIFAQTSFAYRDFLNEYLLNFREYIAEYRVATVTRMWHYHRHYLLEGEKDLPAEMMGFDEKTAPIIDKIDEKDYAILQLLLKNARMPTLEIAHRIGMSETNTRHRLKRLIDSGIILGFRTFLNIGQLGYKYFKVHIGLRGYTAKEKSQLITYLHQHKATAYNTELINGHDLEPEFQVKSIEELHGHIRELRERFGSIIRYYEILQYVKEHKFTYLPEIIYHTA
jgi:DNA-binding Lrp family transcriptional regulator